MNPHGKEKFVHKIEAFIKSRDNFYILSLLKFVGKEKGVHKIIEFIYSPYIKSPNDCIYIVLVHSPRNKILLCILMTKYFLFIRLNRLDNNTLETMDFFNI